MKVVYSVLALSVFGVALILWGYSGDSPLAISSAAIAECEHKRITGELKTHVESVLCSNPIMIQAFQHGGSSYTDLVQRIAATRLDEARKLDEGKIDEAQAARDLDEYFLRVSEGDNNRGTVREQAHN